MYFLEIMSKRDKNVPSLASRNESKYFLLFVPEDPEIGSKTKFFQIVLNDILKDLLGRSKNV